MFFLMVKINNTTTLLKVLKTSRYIYEVKNEGEGPLVYMVTLT